MDDIVNTTLDLLNFEYFARILLPGKCYKALLKNWEITNGKNELDFFYTRKKLKYS